MLANNEQQFTKDQLFNELKKDGINLTQQTLKRAERGIGDALLDIVVEYEAKGDTTKEIAWLRLAAERNVSHAQYRMGYKYFYGQGVPQNYLIAIEWYIKAVKGNHKTAKLRLAQTFKNGCGVNPDMKRALEWFYKYDVNYRMIATFNNDGFILEQEQIDKTLDQLIKETEDILGHEKVKCKLSKTSDLTKLHGDQTEQSFQRDLININRQLELLEVENCMLRSQLEEKENKITLIRKSYQSSTINFVKEKKKIKDQFAQEILEKDNVIASLESKTENLLKVIEKMKREKENVGEVDLLDFSPRIPFKAELCERMDNLSLIEGAAK